MQLRKLFILIDLYSCLYASAEGERSGAGNWAPNHWTHNFLRSKAAPQLLNLFALYINLSGPEPPQITERCPLPEQCSNNRAPQGTNKDSTYLDGAFGPNNRTPEGRKDSPNNRAPCSGIREERVHSPSGSVKAGAGPKERAFINFAVRVHKELQKNNGEISPRRLAVGEGGVSTKIFFEIKLEILSC